MKLRKRSLLALSGCQHAIHGLRILSEARLEAELLNTFRIAASSDRTSAIRNFSPALGAAFTGPATTARSVNSPRKPQRRLQGRGRANPVPRYYYRILRQQGTNAPAGTLSYVVKGKMIGGFALLAYPAEYGNSGVMTFLINHNGVAYRHLPVLMRLARFSHPRKFFHTAFH